MTSSNLLGTVIALGIGVAITDKILEDRKKRKIFESCSWKGITKRK